MASERVTMAEAVAALRAKRDATTNPEYQRRLDQLVAELEGLALDILIARGFMTAEEFRRAEELPASWPDPGPGGGDRGTE